MNIKNQGRKQGPNQNNGLNFVDPRPINSEQDPDFTMTVCILNKDSLNKDFIMIHNDIMAEKAANISRMTLAPTTAESKPFVSSQSSHSRYYSNRGSDFSYSSLQSPLTNFSNNKFFDPRYKTDYQFDNKNRIPLSDYEKVKHFFQIPANLLPRRNSTLSKNIKSIPQRQLIDLRVRSQLIRRPRKLQITTNNAHKKYINCIKNVFYKVLTEQQIQKFQQKYIKHKSSRAYFFVILVYIKYRFTSELGLAVKQEFQKQMNERLREYSEQIYQSYDHSIKNCRNQEIKEISIALRAIKEFYLGNTRDAIEFLYRKNKRIIVKQNHFLASVKKIQQMEEEYSKIQQPRISKPCFKEHYHKRFKNDDQQNSLDRQNCNYQFFGEPIGQIVQNSKENVNDNSKIEGQDSIEHVASSLETDNNRVSEKSHQRPMNVKDMEIGKNTNFRHPSFEFTNFPRNQLPNNQQKNMADFFKNNARTTTETDGFPQRFQRARQRSILIEPQIEVNARELKEFAKSNEHQQILFPPIPPYFYEKDFDQKYGHLFRKLAYVQVWRECHNDHNFSRKEDNWVSSKPYVPAPINFQTFGFHKSK